MAPQRNQGGHARAAQPRPVQSGSKRSQTEELRGKHAKPSSSLPALPSSPPPSSSGELLPDADNAPTAQLPVVRDSSLSNDSISSPVKSIPEAAVARLALYLRVLTGLVEQNVRTVSSEELAEAVGINSAKLRKDLSYIGSYGTRGVGYDITVLVDQIKRTLGLDREHKVAVVGIGNLGHALANYGGFPGRGFPVEALFDLDPDLIGIAVGGLPVSHVNDISEICAERQISVGVIATPPMAAQAVCDRLVAGGVRSILNFAPVVLRVPPQVEVRKVDLAVELQILSFHVAQRGGKYTEIPGAEAFDAKTSGVRSDGAQDSDVGTNSAGNNSARARNDARNSSSVRNRNSSVRNSAEASTTGVHGETISPSAAPIRGRV